MRITNKQAWDIAAVFGKRPPYRGYATDLGNGKAIVLPPNSKDFLLIETPVTPEKVQKALDS
jgi:hypothetical protein